MTEEDVQDNLQFKPDCVLNFDTTNLDIPIYRVYPIDRLLQVFNQKKNTLVKPLMWDDPFENLIFQQTAKTSDGKIVHFDNIQECLYGQCWTLNTAETDALWRIYSPNKNGVRVESTLKKVWDSFYNEKSKAAMITFFIGKISYETETEIKDYFENSDNLQAIFSSSGAGIVNTLLFKRKEFEHENEVRIIYRANDEDFDISKSIFQYDIDPIDLFDELLFDPRFDNGIYDVMKSEFNRRGFNKPIEKSKLYQPPKYDLKLHY